MYLWGILTRRVPLWPLEPNICSFCWFVFRIKISSHFSIHFVTKFLKYNCHFLSSCPKSFRFPSVYDWFSAHLLPNMPNYQSPKGQKSTTLSHDHADIFQPGRTCGIQGDGGWERGQLCPWGFLEQNSASGSTARQNVFRNPEVIFFLFTILIYPKSLPELRCLWWNMPGCSLVHPVA